MVCTQQDCLPLFIATIVLGVVAGAFILISAAAIACTCALCCKLYRFKRIRCSIRAIHCLCCSCEVKDIQTDEEDGTDTTGPAAEDPPPRTGSILTYEEVAHPTEIAGNLGNRHPEPLPRPLLPGTRPLPPHTDDTVSDDGNYIEIVEDTNNGTGEASVSVEIPPPPGLTPSSTLNKRVTREEVRSFRQRRWSSGKSEDDEVPLLGDPVSKSGYKSTEKVLSLPARTLPNRAEPGSKLAHRQVHTLCQRPREGRDDGGGHISQSNDAASSDDTVSSNPAAVRVWSLSLPAREEYT